MLAKSHRLLGQFLAKQYFPDIPELCIKAFIIGCSQPDKNITTYLKGSLRCQWLKGHNWDNAQRYMQRLADRLEQRKKLRSLDYYALGKLVHYTADAFTAPHNKSFSPNLQEHRQYERILQQHFLRVLESTPGRPAIYCGSVTETIQAYHLEYEKIPANIQTDTQYCLAVTQGVVEMLTTPHFSSIFSKIKQNCSCNIPRAVV